MRLVEKIRQVESVIDIRTFERMIPWQRCRIQNLVLGMVATNCYFLLNADTKEMILVDPADEAEAIEEKVNAMGGRPVAVLLTHGHYDHMLAADSVRRTYQIPVYVHELDEAVLEDASLNLSGFWSSSFMP